MDADDHGRFVASIDARGLRKDQNGSSEERGMTFCDWGATQLPVLIVSVGHQLSQDEALRRIQAAVAQAKTLHSDKIEDLREGWHGYVGTFQISARNQQASGTVTVNPSDVTVQTTLPFLALVFKPMIESGMRDELARIVA